MVKRLKEKYTIFKHVAESFCLGDVEMVNGMVEGQTSPEHSFEISGRTSSPGTQRLVEFSASIKQVTKILDFAHDHFVDGTIKVLIPTEKRRKSRHRRKIPRILDLPLIPSHRYTSPKSCVHIRDLLRFPIRERLIQ